MLLIILGHVPRAFGLDREVTHGCGSLVGHFQSDPQSAFDSGKMLMVAGMLHICIYWALQGVKGANPTEPGMQV